MLAFEIITNIGKYLEFRDKIELKKTCRFLNEAINIYIIPDKYLDIIDISIFKNYPKCKISELSESKRRKLVIRELEKTRQWIQKILDEGGFPDEGQQKNKCNLI